MHVSSVAAVVLCAGALVAGCGDGGAGPRGDGGVGDAADDASAVAVTPPAPPIFVPCPSGWRELVVSNEPTTCEPWPASGEATCSAVDEAHFPGEPRCARVGTQCPAGDFPEGLPADARVLYALAGAPAGGDGTSARPFASVATALARATDGTIVAIGKGEYDEPLVAGSGVTLWGACTAQTLLRAHPSVAQQGVVRVTGRNVALRNLRVGDSPTHGVVVIGATASATLEDVVVDRVTSQGVNVSAGTLSAHGLVVRGTVADTDGRFGRGIQAINGAQVAVEHFVLRDLRDQGALVAGPGTHLRLVDGAIVDTVASDVVRSGWGFGASDDATGELERVVVERATSTAVAGTGGTSLTLRDVVVRGVRPDAMGATAKAISFVGTMLDATRLRVEQTRDTAVLLSEEGTVARLTDTVLRDAVPSMASGVAGSGIQIQLGAQCELDRVDVRRVATAGIVVLRAPTRVLARDLLIADAAGDAHGAFGRGISVGSGATATVERAAVERVRDIGVVSGGVGAVTTISDLVVSDTRAAACATTTCADRAFGIGAGAHDGASLSLTRFEIRRSALCGVLVANGSEVDLVGGEIRENTIGACVQVDGYDTSRLTNGVRYVDNDRLLESTMLPVPDSVSPVP